ncbi:MAG: ATP-grasp domain-containing protein [Clostridia bacterium]|nr:ATP-grasp domain-containing protein [Clostridia bacterium]
MKFVAVFFGGQSIEHDVSIITGALTVNALDKDRYVGVPIYVSHEGDWYTGEKLKDVDGYKNLNLKKLTKVTLVCGSNVLYAVKNKRLKPLCTISAGVNCMHGERGEDGSLAGLLNLSGIPLASPPAFASSTAISKTNSKIFLKGAGIKVLPSVSVTDISQTDAVTKKLNFPLFVKPDCGGSSIGVGRADDENGLKEALSVAFRYGERVIVEPFVKDFIEINCACYFADGRYVVSECEKPIKTSEYLSFGDKYCEGQREFPARIGEGVSQRIRSITKKVYQKLDARGVIRIDYMLIDGEIYLNEINTVPGSLAYYLFADTLSGFSIMLNDLILEAERRMAKSQTVIKKFSSSIITGLSGSKGAKRLKNT